LRFNQYLANYAATTRLLANHRRLSQYLEPLFWFPEEHVEPTVYAGFRPPWLPDFFERNALLAPSHVALVDTRGQVREIYQASAEPLPDELLADTHQWMNTESEAPPVLIRLAEQPYLLISNRVEDTGGYTMGRLMVLVAIDADFLTAAAGEVSSDRSVIALIDSDEQRILATNEPERLTPGTLVDRWRSVFLITSQSLPAYEGSNWNMVFATFVPQRSIQRMSRHVVHFERRQRVIAALVFIGVFTLVIYLVSARLNKVLTRMSRFSQRALGIEHPAFSRGGNQLLLLEEWIQQFTQLVLHAREEMSRRHASEMRVSESLRAAIMEASLDAIVTLHRDGRVIDCNPTAERMLGLESTWTRQVVFAQHFIASEDQDAFHAMLGESAGHRLGEHQTHVRGELQARHADHTRIPVELSIVPIDLDEERFYTLYIHDITKRKQAEQEIKSAEQASRQHQAELVHVCRLSTLGEVATGMAHELNQPLSAIVNYARGASRRLQSGADQTEALIEAMSRIASQAERAGEIIRRLRALVGKQPPIRAAADLNHLVREVCGFVEFETERLGLTIELDLAAGELPVDVDLVQIEQVLLNLVRNALDALAEQPEDRRALKITTRVHDATAEGQVTDTGPGIPPERMVHLFDPFFTTKDSGMGMGLPISQTILDNHQGRIWAESTPGQGARFFIRLPMVSS
jgi:PAS domain S-box-containing protein